MIEIKKKLNIMLSFIQCNINNDKNYVHFCTYIFATIKRNTNFFIQKIILFKTWYLYFGLVCKTFYKQNIAEKICIPSYIWTSFTCNKQKIYVRCGIQAKQIQQILLHIHICFLSNSNYYFHSILKLGMAETLLS